MNPKLLVVPALLLPLILTGCSVNAPIQVPVDIHDNTVNTGPVTGTPSGGTSDGFDSNGPLTDVDPNAPQDIPDGWDSSDVDTPQDVVIP
jgi:hypothetical protein